MSKIYSQREEILSRELNLLHRQDTPFAFWQGFITGIVCSPQEIMPTVWNNYLLDPKGEGPGEGLKDGGKEIVALALEEFAQLDEALQKTETEVFAKIPREELKYWVEGFLESLPFWGEEVQEDISQELELLLQTFFMIYDPEKYFSGPGMPQGEKSRAAELEKAFEFFPFLVKELWILRENYRIGSKERKVDTALLTKVKEDLEKEKK